MSGSAISVSLSIAAADVALLARGREADPRQKLSEFARDAVRLSVDGETLPSVNDEVSIEDGGARVGLSFAIPHSSDQARRLTITSDVPKRVSRGHRELLIVNVGGRVAIEKLLDVESDSVAVDLGAASPSAAGIAWSFLALGIRHILSGYDHLVFLAGLLLAARAAPASCLGFAAAGRELVVALTAFTAAHSVSLALVVIGGVRAPASIVEPLIAASIAWVGVENLLRERAAPKPAAEAGHRTRWLVVFGFGLIHGFGFAGALMELGLGSSVADVALALLSFNAGVEAGQLAAAAAMLPLVWTIRSRPVWQARLLPSCSGLVAMAGGYWLIERLQ